MFLQENMDIKDGVTTSSKEQMKNLVRVQEHDEITPKGSKDQSVTKEHPRGFKCKRPNFVREDLHLGREDDIVKIMQVEGAKCIKARGPTGAKG
jgi:hypothetical protein